MKVPPGLCVENLFSGFFSSQRFSLAINLACFANSMLFALGKFGSDYVAGQKTRPVVLSFDPGQPHL